MLGDNTHDYNQFYDRTAHIFIYQSNVRNMLNISNTLFIAVFFTMIIIIITQEYW